MGESNEMGAQLGRPLLWLVLLRDLTALFSQLPSLPDAGDLRLDTLGHQDCQPAEEFNMITFDASELVLSNLGGHLDPTAEPDLYITNVGYTPAPSRKRIDLLITNTSRYEAWRDEQNGVSNQCAQLKARSFISATR